MTRLSKTALILAALVPALACTTIAADTAVVTMDPIGPTGTLSFVLHADKTYTNGGTGEPVAQTLLQLPGLGEAIFQRGYRSIFIAFY